MYKALHPFALLLFCSSLLIGQTLPAGKWQLDQYRFGDKVERPLESLDITLNVRADGHLGGSSGCNVYGGSWSEDGGKLAITDIISTMRACEEPTPLFEKSFFDVLEKASSVETKDGTLLITEESGHFLRFVKTN